MDEPAEQPFSTQVIIDFDRRDDGTWEIAARFDASDMIAGWDVDSLDKGLDNLGPILIDAVNTYAMQGVTVEYRQAINVARELIGDSDNTEYARAMCELIGDLWGRPGVELGDRKMEVAHVLGVKL